MPVTSESRRIDDLERLLDIARIAAAPLDPDGLAHLGVEKVLALTRSEVACLLLRERDALVERVAWGLDREVLARVGGEGGVLRRVVLDDAGIVLAEIPAGLRLSLPSGREAHLRGLLGVPLRHAGRPLGALFVGNPEEPYDEDDLRLLEAAGEILALGIVTSGRFGRAAAEAEELAVLGDLGRLVARAAALDEAGLYIAHAAEALLSLDTFAVITIDLGTRPHIGAPVIGAIEIETVGRRLEAAVEAALERPDATVFRPHVVEADGRRRSLYFAPLPGGERTFAVVGTGPAVEAGEYDRRMRLFHLLAAHAAGVIARFGGTPHKAAAPRPQAGADRLAEIGAMAAGIAHEVKNPLTALKGYAELLPARKTDPAFLERFGRVVLDEVARLDRLVGDLLALARPPAGPPREVDLARLAEGLAELVRPEAAAHSIEVAVEAAPARVRADAESLRRAVLNLARNAIEAMRETGGRLTLRTRVEGGEAALDVADTGPGISPAVRARLFEPFVSGRPGGTGLGLSIAARIVAGAGGRIEARSTPGEGAVFTVRIPAA